MYNMKKYYNDHKARSRKRQIPFNLTYKEWVDIWGSKIAQRGSKPHEYCMARLGDIGAYEIGNVKIITNRENNLEQFSNKPLGAKLTEEQVLEIRSRPRKWGDVTKWAKEFNVDRTTIDAIVNNRQWTHI